MLLQLAVAQSGIRLEMQSEGGYEVVGASSGCRFELHWVGVRIRSILD